MFDVCWGCGEWTPEKGIEERPVADRPGTVVAVCPECGYEHPFRHLPLLIVAGASGTGKSTVLAELLRDTVEGDSALSGRIVLLESDILWGVGQEMELEDYMDLWQRLCVAIHQSGRPVVLFGAGLHPGNVEPATHRRYFPAVHYLALLADEATLAERLDARPDWRGSSEGAFVREQVEYDRALREREPVPEGVPFETLDTSDRSIRESVDATRAWIEGVLARYEIWCRRSDGGV